jgi:hypothetical protein
VTNALITGIIGSTIAVLVLWYVGGKVKRGKYNRFVGLVQWVFEGLLGQINDVIPDKKIARSITPLAVTIFFVVLFNYWLSVMPGMETVKVGDVPLFRSMASDLNFTLGLAIISIVAVQIYAVKHLGAFNNLHRYFRNPIKDPIDALFTIDSTGDVVVDGATQVIGNGDTTKLKLVNSGVTAGTYGENTDLTIVSGDTITVPKVTIDSKGRVTSAENQEVKINITGSVNRIDALNPTLTQSSGVCTWTVQHDLNCEYPVSSLYEVSTGEMVMADIKTTSANVLTITILSSTDIVAGTYHIAICG